jgi:hypothetical protein
MGREEKAFGEKRPGHAAAPQYRPRRPLPPSRVCSYILLTLCLAAKYPTGVLRGGVAAPRQHISAGASVLPLSNKVAATTSGPLSPSSLITTYVCVLPRGRIGWIWVQYSAFGLLLPVIDAGPRRPEQLVQVAERFSTLASGKSSPSPRSPSPTAVFREQRSDAFSVSYNTASSGYGLAMAQMPTLSPC